MLLATSRYILCWTFQSELYRSFWYCGPSPGRAGLLGLAISLVSTVPERVWYVKAKGYKPWLNPKPQDVKHNDEGGHTIWYNEPELLQVAPPSVLPPPPPRLPMQCVKVPSVTNEMQD